MPWSGEVGTLDLEKRDYMEPLEWDENGKIVWPLKVKPGRAMYKSTVTAWAHLLRALADHPEETKHRASQALWERAGLPKITSSAMSSRFLELEYVGLIKRVHPHQRATDYVGLEIPVEQLPDEVMSIILPGHLNRAEPEAPPAIEPESEGSEGVETVLLGEGERPGAQHPSAVAVANALLDELLRRLDQPDISKEQVDELVQRLTTAHQRISDLEDHEAALIKLKEALQASEKKVKEENRAFRVRIDHLEEENRGLERNLQTAVREVERLRALNGAATSTTQSRLNSIVGRMQNRK